MLSKCFEKDTENRTHTLVDYRNRDIRLLLDAIIPEELHTKTKQKLIPVLKILLGNLKRRSELHAKGLRKTPLLYVPLQAGFYSGAGNTLDFPGFKFTYRIVRKALDILLRHNIIGRNLGFKTFDKVDVNGKTYVFPTEGKLTEIWINPLAEWKVTLPDKIEDGVLLYLQFQRMTYGETTCKNRELFIRKEKEYGYVYRKDKTRDIRGRKLPTTKSGKPKKTRYNHILPVSNSRVQALAEINADLPEHMRFKRVFGKEPYTYGRFFSVFAGFPSALRQRFYQHYDLVELDYDSFNLNLLFLADTGRLYSGDIYYDLVDSLGVPRELRVIYRKLLKTAFLSVFGSSSREEAYKSIRKSVLVDSGIYVRHGRDPQKRSQNQQQNWKKTLNRFSEKDLRCYALTPGDVIAGIERLCQPIQGRLYQAIAGSAQYSEAIIMESLLQEAKKAGVPLLGIHDCIVVPKGHAPYFRGKMADLLYEESQRFSYRSNKNITRKSFERLRKDLTPELITKLPLSLNWSKFLSVLDFQTLESYENEYIELMSILPSFDRHNRRIQKELQEELLREVRVLRVAQIKSNYLKGLACPWVLIFEIADLYRTGETLGGWKRLWLRWFRRVLGDGCDNALFF